MGAWSEGWGVVRRGGGVAADGVWSQERQPVVFPRFPAIGALDR